MVVGRAHRSPNAAAMASLSRHRVIDTSSMPTCRSHMAGDHQALQAGRTSDACSAFAEGAKTAASAS